MKNRIRNAIQKRIKKLLAPVIREVIKEREDEFIATTLQLARHERESFRDNTTSFAQ